MTKYLIDTNVFIDAIDKYDCMVFLLWVQSTNGADSVSAVYEEIENRKHNRTLYDWKKRNMDLFLKPNDTVISKMREVVDWARNAGYNDNAVDAFCDGADYILVAHACVSGCIVVTHEAKNDFFNAERIKIPNACEEFGVGWMTGIEMLEAEQARFLNDPKCNSI